MVIRLLYTYVSVPGRLFLHRKSIVLFAWSSLWMSLNWPQWHKNSQNTAETYSRATNFPRPTFWVIFDCNWHRVHSRSCLEIALMINQLWWSTSVEATTWFFRSECCLASCSLACSLNTDAVLCRRGTVRAETKSVCCLPQTQWHFTCIASMRWAWLCPVAAVDYTYYNRGNNYIALFSDLRPHPVFDHLQY